MYARRTSSWRRVGRCLAVIRPAGSRRARPWAAPVTFSSTNRGRNRRWVKLALPLSPRPNSPATPCTSKVYRRLWPPSKDPLPRMATVARRWLAEGAEEDESEGLIRRSASAGPGAPTPGSTREEEGIVSRCTLEGIAAPQARRLRVVKRMGAVGCRCEVHRRFAGSPGRRMTRVCLALAIAVRFWHPRVQREAVTRGPCSGRRDRAEPLARPTR